MSWEMVIGLETHIELATKTKIFCGCEASFGGAQNTHCCPVCTGQPGSMPSLNAQVVEYAAAAGLALGCTVNTRSIMSRKHYVYPDLPKAYQISQFDKPLCEWGSVTLSSGREIRITRIHIEEDAGKLIHRDDGIFIDYNRGGVPLIEIVTEPDFRSAQEVSEYLEELQGMMRAIGVSDCRMQEGSLRCDVNISLRREGEAALGTRAEVKNLNSFTSVVAAIEYEYARQSKLLESGGRVVQETRGFNADSGETVSQRSKENADDYRYFPEPDIVPVLLSAARIEELRRTLPELPAARRARYVAELGLTDDDARMLTKYRRVSEYFEAAADGVQGAKTVSSFMLTQMFSVITTEIERENWSPPVAAESLRELVLLLESGKLNRNLAKRVFSQMMETGKRATDLLSPEDLQAFSDDELKSLCSEAVAQNEKTVSDYRAGKEKAIKSLVGAVMKASRGRADAVSAEAELKRILAE